MEKLINTFKQMQKADFSFEKLGEFVDQYDFSTLEYESLLPAIKKPGVYAREILLLDPIEVVLLHWPVGVESGIHFHNGFYGYVVILEGEGEDVVYEHQGDQFKDVKRTRCFKGGVIGEPDGVIHKIRNPNPREKLVTLHIYYPPVADFQGTKIYDIENERIGILNDKAETASWSDDPSHFEEIIENAFQYRSFQQQYPGASHRMILVNPKPDPEKISQMNTEYYDEQALSYDNFDLNHPTRSSYTKTIDRLIGEDLKQSNGTIRDKLVLACGTGRRALEQMELAESEFEVTGVDMSTEMTKIAAQKGIKMIRSPWLNAPMDDDKQFDAATFLYAFGHIADKERRVATLKKLNKHLKIGSPFYLDVFNRYDKHEWGPEILESYRKYNLEKFGYDEGDTFYCKIGGRTLAFVHYFTEEEITDLLRSTGFRIEKIYYIGYVENSGEILDRQDEGFLFIKATKVSEAD